MVGFSAIMLHCSGNKTAKQKHSSEFCTETLIDSRGAEEPFTAPRLIYLITHVLFHQPNRESSFLNWLHIVSEPTCLRELLQSDESKQHDSGVGLGALEEQRQILHIRFPHISPIKQTINFHVIIQP